MDLSSLFFTKFYSLVLNIIITYISKPYQFAAPSRTEEFENTIENNRVD
jgi:hypothetical protein